MLQLGLNTSTTIKSLIFLAGNEIKNNKSYF